MLFGGHRACIALQGMRCEHAQSLLTTSTEAPPVRPCLAVRPTSATAAGGRHPRGCRWHRACLHSASKYVLVLATSRPLAQLCLIISRLAMMSHTVSIFLYRGNSGRSNRFVLAAFPYSGVARSSILIHDSRKYERQPPLTIAVLPGSDLHLGCIASCTVADLNSICSSENAPAERPFDCTSQGKRIEQHVVTIRRVQYAQSSAYVTFISATHVARMQSPPLLCSQLYRTVSPLAYHACI